MDDYQLMGYRKSKTKYKKYDAILKNKKTGRLTHVPFGDNRYEAMPRHARIMQTRPDLRVPMAKPCIGFMVMKKGANHIVKDTKHI